MSLRNIFRWIAAAPGANGVNTLIKAGAQYCHVLVPLIGPMKPHNSTYEEIVTLLDIADKFVTETTTRDRFFATMLNENATQRSRGSLRGGELEDPIEVARRLQDLLVGPSGAGVNRALINLWRATQRAEPEIITIPSAPFPDKAGKRMLKMTDASNKPFRLATVPSTHHDFFPFARFIGLHLLNEDSESIGRARRSSHDYPITRVGWSHAQTFAKMLAAFTGKPYRLPSGREWLRAAKGLPVDLNEMFRDAQISSELFFDQFINPSGSDWRYDSIVLRSPDDVAQEGGEILNPAESNDVNAIVEALRSGSAISALRVFPTNIGSATRENTWAALGKRQPWQIWKELSRPDHVRSRPPTPNGLYDMSGNVREWVVEEGSPAVAGGSYETDWKGRGTLVRVQALDPADLIAMFGAPDIGVRLALEVESP